jgi:bifunctional ADP-heptose synthase (sugar kinase/adenylyltransferase)
MSAFRVAVFGDRMVDFYHIGEASGLSAEVPIPVVKVKETIYFPGGAGNVVANLEALDVEVADYTVDKFRGVSYPQKNRLMVGDHQVARWDKDDVCIPYLGKAFMEVDAVVVADYGKGAIDRDTIEKIKLMNGPIFVDTKNNPSIWSGVATAVFPNSKELAQFINEYHAFKGIVVHKEGVLGLSLWPNGIGGCRDNDEVIKSYSQARFVRSVNGAGDTVIAAFVYKYLDLNPHFIAPFTQGTWECILNFANAAAAIAVENPYTYAPTKDEVLQRYENR